MMSPNQEQGFRDVSETRARSLLAGGHSFLCPVCKRIMPRLGRQARGGKLGFRCFECKEKRDERMKAKAET